MSYRGRYPCLVTVIVLKFNLPCCTYCFTFRESNYAFWSMNYTIRIVLISLLCLITLVTISLRGTYLNTNCSVSLEYMFILRLPWKLPLLLLYELQIRDVMDVLLNKGVLNRTSDKDCLAEYAPSEVADSMTASELNQKFEQGTLQISQLTPTQVRLCLSWT